MRPRSVLLWLLSSAFVVTASAQPITYQLESPEVLKNLSAREIAVLEKINRADAEHLGRPKSVVVPSRFDADELEYSPLPRRIDELAGAPKALIVYQPQQVFGAYEAGELVRWGPVSTGRREFPTPSGAFHLNWRSPGRHSTDDPDWFMKWYYNFDNRRGLALHQLELPGRPASHACVRLLERDAKWIYEWGDGWVLDERGWEVLEQGTPLWIIGQYDFDAPPPWLNRENPHPAVDAVPFV